MPKVYLSASFLRQAEMRDVREKLALHGIRVVSSWLDEQNQRPEEVCAARDLEDIENADELLSFTELSDAGYMTGGRHVELGYALGRGVSRFAIIGPRENVFHHLSFVEQFDSLDAWLAART